MVATANSQFQFVGLPFWGRGFVNSAQMPTARKTTHRGYQGSSGTASDTQRLRQIRFSLLFYPHPKESAIWFRELSHVRRENPNIKWSDDDHVHKLNSKGLKLIGPIHRQAHAAHPVFYTDSIAEFRKQLSVVGADDEPPLHSPYWTAGKDTGRIELRTTRVRRRIRCHDLKPHLQQHPTYSHRLSRFGENAQLRDPAFVYGFLNLLVHGVKANVAGFHATPNLSKARCHSRGFTLTGRNAKKHSEGKKWETPESKALHFCAKVLIALTAHNAIR